MGHPVWLPPTINLNGNWAEKQKELYSIFIQDFIDPPRPSFRNLPIYHDNRKLDGSSYEEGFWHIVTRTDPSTGERIPDFRRAERLKWCLSLIQNYSKPEVTFWKYDNGKNIRTYLWLEEHDYVVVIEEREKRRQAFLNTAYHVDGPSMRRSLQKKYEKRLNS